MYGRNKGAEGQRDKEPVPLPLCAASHYVDIVTGPFLESFGYIHEIGLLCRG
jgi:hypothetical protein